MEEVQEKEDDFWSEEYWLWEENWEVDVVNEEEHLFGKNTGTKKMTREKRIVLKEKKKTKRKQSRVMSLQSERKRKTGKKMKMRRNL